jgi:hypothetical protein
MTTRIAFDASSASGQLMAEAIDDVLSARAKMARLQGILYAAWYADDPEAVAAEVGANPASGATIFALIEAANTALDAAAITQLRELDQG